MTDAAGDAERASGTCETKAYGAVRAGPSAIQWQVAAVLVAWLYMVALHWDNDGLWCQGDSPRHAANGLFWKDFLRSPSLDAKPYALSYFARYPVINPVSYPPVFYLLEGALFGVFGPSLWAAKGLVLAFSLMAALYTSAWLRRWVAPGAGFVGALVPLLPGVVVWSHAIMLNVPSFALALAGMYHVRRWLEEPESRQVYPAAAMSVLAILCYIPAAVIVFVQAAWLAASGRWRLLLHPRTLAVAAACAVALLPWTLLVLHNAQGHVEMTTPAPRMLAEPSNWAYYARDAPEMFGWPLTILAGAGIVAGSSCRRWRREVAMPLIWVCVVYVVLSYLKAKSPRYLLMLAAPLSALGAITIFTVARWLDRISGRPVSKAVIPAMIIGLLASQAWLAWWSQVPVVRGFREVVAFLEDVAPDEPVFYDGHYNGVFTFLVRAGDPDYRRQVVRGDKLLYTIPLNGSMEAREYIASPREVIDALRKRSGCRWLAIERGAWTAQIAASRLSREAVEGSEFELVRSFPIVGPYVERVDVYRLRGPVDRVDEIDLPLHMLLGEDVRRRIRPIARRAASPAADVPPG